MILRAEEDTILAQLYEIEDMENPSEEDLRNYRNLEIRYGELTRMDAEDEDVDDGCCFVELITDAMETMLNHYLMAVVVTLVILN